MEANRRQYSCCYLFGLCKAAYCCSGPVQFLLLLTVLFCFSHLCFAIQPICLQNFRCKCPLGYRWSNRTNDCEDVNECERKNLNLCPNSSLCANTNGSYHCQIPGMANPCNSNPCQHYQHCLEIERFKFTCSCNDGFKYNGNECIATSCSECGTSYIVTGENETVKSIAEFCDLKISTILRLNPNITSNKVLSIGQKLDMLCSGRDWQKCGPCGVRYLRKGNENASAIAGRCGINDAIMQRIKNQTIALPCAVELMSTLNRCEKCGALVKIYGPTSLQNVSQQCNVPVAKVSEMNPALGGIVKNETLVFLPCDSLSSRCGPCGSFYKVKANDTLGVIADMCGTSSFSIQQANPQLDDPNKINPGLILNMPCGAETPFPMATNSAIHQHSKSWFFLFALHLFILFVRTV